MSLLFFFACSGAPADDTALPADTGDTAAAGDTNYTTGGTAAPLEDGEYDGEILSAEDNACMAIFGEANLSVAPVDLTGTSATTFSQVGAGYATDCTVDATGAGSCTDYSVEIGNVTADAALTFDVTVPSVTVTSTTTFDQVENVSLVCSGMDCKAVGEGYGVVFPCDFDVYETWWLD